MSDEEVYRLPPVPAGTVNTTYTNAEWEVQHAARQAATDAAIARRQADVAVREEARARLVQEQAERELDAFMDSAREGFLRSGGRESEWRAAGADIRQRHLTELAMQGDPRERAIKQAMRELRTRSGDGF